jgi:hypothetical protein
MDYPFIILGGIARCGKVAAEEPTGRLLPGQQMTSIERSDSDDTG